MRGVYKIGIYIILSGVFLFSCEKKYQSEPQPIPASGIITLKSEGDHYQSIGFSFSTASIVPIPIHQHVMPDFMLLVMMDVQNEVNGV